eukprot:COSAG04_NODE_279_length_18210_cov_5.657225_1_plen_1569_part_10
MIRCPLGSRRVGLALAVLVTAAASEALNPERAEYEEVERWIADEPAAGRKVGMLDGIKDDLHFYSTRPPIWANHTLAERTTNLQRYYADRQSARRRAQSPWAEPHSGWSGSSAQERQSSLTVALDPTGSPSSTCDDPLAVNTDQSLPCAYDCQDLQQEYFPAPQSQTTRCFLFDPNSNTWPEAGGEGAELLGMRKQRFETHTYISREAGTNSPPSGLSFTMGEGRVCQNVTVKSSFMGPVEPHIEVFCLVDGEHEYNHTITEQHSVEVVGYAESGVHDGAGGTTSFVVGECVDVLIRVTTTSAGGESVSWSLDDGGHNGPWLFDSVGAVYEQETCMFDNDFTLTKLSAAASWQGSVKVSGFIRYHNTITIPSDENWIVQGRIDPVSGLPSGLDARLKSGTAIDRSHASIVLRQLRISGQVAPVDANQIPRAEGHTGGFGGALEYDGGGNDPSNLPKLVFIELILDHNSASSRGGAVMIDGRAARQASLDESVQNWDSGIEVTMRRCTYFRNHSPSFAGGLAVINVWPLTLLSEDVDFIQNEALVYQQDYYKWFARSGPEPKTGLTSISHTRTHYDGGHKSAGIFSYAVPTGIWITPLDSEPDAVWDATWQQATWVDHGAIWFPGIFFNVYPVLPDLQLRLNANLVESSIVESITVQPRPSKDDGTYLWYSIPVGESRATRCRFARNGVWADSGAGAVGEGGVVVNSPPGGSLVPTLVFDGSEWTGNANAMGPAVYVRYGQIDVRFRRCMFLDNLAYKSGGAIFMLGSQASTLLIEESILEANAVRVPSDQGSAYVTVLLNTGSFLIDADMTGDVFVPIWRIDDGPVHGISSELCQGAAERSRTAVSRGYPASWPGLTCANVSYFGPELPYSHTVRLTVGPHTLWTGLLVKTSFPAIGWGQAWIEVVDFIGPLFPSVSEVRTEQFSGCRFAGCEGALKDLISCCPKGIAMWSSHDFEVRSGKGGAVATSGRIELAISDTVFRANEAVQGASLSITAASRVSITNTSINTAAESSSSAVRLVAAAVDDCNQNPCALGSRCTFKDHSTFCEVCRSNEFGADGISCDACPPGTHPDATQTDCLACPPGQHSTIGSCVSCLAGKASSEDRTGCVACEPGTYRGTEDVECHLCLAGSQPNSEKTGCESCTGSGKNAFSADGRECHDCPARNAPNDERTACFCQADTYSAIDLGLITCRGTSFRSDGMESDECAVCPSCLDCAIVGQTMLKSGWAFFGQGEAYRCPGWNKDFKACPALLLNENTTMDSSTCAKGYEGPVCGNCELEYNHLKVGNPCDPCDDGVINVPLVMGLFLAALAVGGAVISGALGVLQDFGVITDLRILVGFYQILGQASNVLDLVFPFPVPQLVDFIKLLFLDVRKIVMLDCWNIGGFYGKITTNILVVPAVIGGVCLLIYISQKRTLMAVIAAGASDESGLEVLKVKLKQNLFLGIFLVYPTITATLFRVPQCQYFGEVGFHEDDYTIDCGTAKFTLTVAFAALVIILIPIGVPAIFLMLMLRKKESLGGVVNETALGGAKLVADDADDESDTYGFLIKDYRPQYWYHEIGTYSRKLLLG